MAGRTPSKRKMSVAPSVSVSHNNMVECSQEMSGIIKRIMVTSHCFFLLVFSNGVSDFMTI